MNYDLNCDYESPPKKKYKRSHQDYAKFLDILKDLRKHHNRLLLECLKWTEHTGVTCDICCADNTLKGFLTKNKPMVNFKYCKFKANQIILIPLQIHIFLLYIISI